MASGGLRTIFQTFDRLGRNMSYDQKINFQVTRDAVIKFIIKNLQKEKRDHPTFTCLLYWYAYLAPCISYGVRQKYSGSAESGRIELKIVL